MKINQIKDDKYYYEVDELRSKILYETDVLQLRHNAARLKYILDVVMMNQNGRYPSDD